MLGWAEFCGLRMAVDAGVFVPRRRTEFLVRRPRRWTTRPPLAGEPGQPGSGRRRAVVADLCCGSGAVGAALAAALGPVKLYAVDIDPRGAMRPPQLTAHGGQVYEGDLYQPLPDSAGPRDILVPSALLPTAEMGLLPPEARLHEARVALDGGADGLDVLRRVAEAAPCGWHRAATCC